MGDDTVKREMWEGKIPVCFRVADEEVNMFSVTGERTVPEPCYVSGVPAMGVASNESGGGLVSRASPSQAWCARTACSSVVGGVYLEYRYHLTLAYLVRGT